MMEKQQLTASEKKEEIARVIEARQRVLQLGTQIILNNTFQSQQRLQELVMSVRLYVRLCTSCLNSSISTLQPSQSLPSSLQVSLALLLVYDRTYASLASISVVFLEFLYALYSPTILSLVSLQTLSRLSLDSLQSLLSSLFSLVFCYSLVRHRDCKPFQAC